MPRSGTRGFCAGTGTGKVIRWIITAGRHQGVLLDEEGADIMVKPALAYLDELPARKRPQIFQCHHQCQRRICRDQAAALKRLD